MAVNHPRLNQSVSAIAVVDLANELMVRGCIDKNVTAHFGAEFARLFKAWQNKEAIQEQRLPESLLILLWQHASAAGSCSNIGLEVGAKVNHNAKGVLANWLSHSNTLAEAFDIFSDNIALLNPSETWQKTFVEDDYVKLSLSFKYAGYPSIAIDRSLAALIAWSDSLCAGTISPLRISLMRPKPVEKMKYLELLGPNIGYSQPENALWFSVDDFNQPIADANPYLKSLLARQGAALNADVSTSRAESLVPLIEQLLRRDLERYCQLSEICDALHLSRSTLYRKLKQESVSFTNLLKTARVDCLKAAQVNIENPHELAALLGFKDIGSYYRFRKTL